MTELGSVLTQVVQVLERERIPYMVIGGFANLVWGEPRTTMGVDVTVDVGDFGLSAFARLAADLGQPDIARRYQTAKRAAGLDR